LIELKELIALPKFKSDSCMVLLTFIYVVGTFLMVFEMIKSRRNLFRPFVNIYFFRKKKLLFLNIENIGNCPCKNITIIFTPKIKFFNEGKKYFPFLPVRQKNIYLVDDMENFFSTEKLSYSVDIVYQNIYINKKYKDTYKVNLETLKEQIDL
jgi:hypothetical protein